MESDADQTIKPADKLTKLCEKCNVKVTHRAWNSHLKSKKHISNEPDDSRKL